MCRSNNSSAASVPDFEVPLSSLEIQVAGDPNLPREISCVQVLNERKQRFERPERAVLAALLEFIKVNDIDVILFPYADYLGSPHIQEGKTLRPEAHVQPHRLVQADGLQVLLELRQGQPQGRSPDTKGIAVPFRKRDAESIRNISELKASDKGGMIFQPEPGVYERVHQIDFTSLYPSIIVKYNLSPETLEHPERSGFLSTVLSSLLNLRIETKRLKKTNPDYKGIDSILKWMLVTCFGYTGYRNAKFGQIQVHERITDTSRELLLQIKELAEEMGFEVLHGIVDCLWVIGEPISVFKEAVERRTRILTEVDSYDWIAFLPMSDGMGAYKRYFGKLNMGKMKIRGVMARKGDTPEYVNRMQQEVFEVLAEAKSLEELQRVEPKARAVRDRYLEGLGGATAGDLAIRRRVSRLNYSRRCAEDSAVQAHISRGFLWL
jgi:DNA polymerase I